MCGIVGYIGDGEALPILLDGLRRLEYRGYDSAGVALLEGRALSVRRRVGRLARLEELLASRPVKGCVGIGHTRWATHGAPSDANAHPHDDGESTLAVVHNGIIENYLDLREELAEKGVRFRTETDTEVLPHLILDALDGEDGDRLDAVRRALRRTKGAYALGIVFRDDPDTLYAARQGSPLLIGTGRGEQFIASDAGAIVQHTNRIVYLEDGQIAALRRDGIRIIDLEGRAVAPEAVEVSISATTADLGGFETYMLKEIHEQPRVLRALLQRFVTEDDRVDLKDFGFDDQTLRGLHRVMAISCGTAYHAAMYAKLLIESMSEIAMETDLASEFRYRRPRMNRTTLLMPISQSGETADTLASVRMAREMGCRVLSICNVPGSSLVRESDAVLFTDAGPEIGVASTKAYTTQLMAIALLAIRTARTRNEIDEEREKELVRQLRLVPDAIHYVIERKEIIRAVAEKHHDGPSSLYLGRRFNVPTALEGALKNKEISYQHAEGYAAGEMKHGPIALVNEYLPVVCICTKTSDEVYEKTISNMQEVHARNGRLIVIATDGDARLGRLSEDVLYVPEICEEFSPLVNVVALQLLAYYAAQARGTDIDKPRNLAKSVTVE